MRTQVTPVADPKALEKATQLLKAGGLVAFPTDTVYGVGAHAFLPRAVESIYRAKGRPLNKAIPLLLHSAESLPQVARDITPEVWVLTENFWPGGLTVVLHRKPVVPDIVTAGGSTVAVRVPDHPFTLRLIQAVGAPLAATSANLTGHPDPQTAQEVMEYLEGRIALILDGGRCPGGIPSTVIDLTKTPPVVVRPGAISRQELEEEIGRLFRAR
ncbi:MAG: L-threonylcarbamoyladenylate synthase [Anaerolineae bacterium]